MSLLLDSEVDCLNGHVPVVAEHMADITKAVESAPADQSEAAKIYAWIQTEKDALKEIDADIKDAKRRVSAAKPKKTKQVEQSEGSASGSDVESEPEAAPVSG